ncbi:MAG: ATP-binding protein, partial [Anaerolineae bacterium]|nr:ATP-binding protein [Anaerolineae bacterium]
VIRAVAFTEGVNEAVATNDQARLQALLFPIVANSKVDRVDIVAADGQHLLTLSRPPGSSNVQDYAVIKGVNLSERTIVQKVLSGVVDELGDKHVELGAIDQDQLFITAGPIQQNGQVVGVVLVSSHVQNLLRLLKQATFSEITLYRLDGTAIRTTLPSLANNLDLLTIPREDIVPLLAFEGSASPRRPVMASNREYDVVPSIFWGRGEPLGFYSIALPTENIVARGSSARNQMAAIFIVALLLVFGIGLVTSRMITGRVQYLMENAIAVAGGDFSRRTEMRADDEIGSLARSLDEMTANLAEYTSALEHKISELTALYESSTAVTVRSSLNLNHVLDAVTTSIAEVMPDIGQVVIHLLDNENRILAPIAASPRTANGFPSFTFSESGRIDNILTQAKPQVIQLAEIETDLLNGSPPSEASTEAIILPLIAGQETIGMMSLFAVTNGMGPSTELDENSQRLLGTFANQAAIAIKNAQLFEATQKAYEELQQLDQLKTEFINIAAHELRTPLGAILGHASSVEKRAPPRLQKYISFITISALRMRTMIDAMLTIQRLDAGTAFLNVSPVDIGSVLQKLANDYRPMAELEGHVLNLHLADDIPEIEVDSEKIGLVFSNLISNAIKFTPEEGHITISALDYGDSILITVEDSGIGLAPEDQAQIFERFYQVRAEDMAQFGMLGVGAGHGGIGIGLTIVKHLIDLHQGEVWVESERGKGSTFFVTLPKKISAETTEPMIERISAQYP